MTMRHEAAGDRRSMAAATARLLLAGLVAIVLLPPLLWAAVGMLSERRHLDDAITSLAWHFERSGVGASNLAAAAQLLASPPFAVQTERRSLVGVDRPPLVELGAQIAPAWPVLEAARDLQRPAVPGGVRLEVQHSLRPLLVSTCLVSLLSSVLALGLWSAVFNPRVRAMRLAERQLRSISKRDPLTGLLNRDGLRITLERAILRRREPRSQVGVMLVDVDRFHLVNNSLGQPAGDELLRNVAARIRGAVRDSDVVARVGADQFAVQAEGVSGTQALAVMAVNLLRAFESPCLVGEQEMATTLSIGIAMADNETTGVDPLLKCAEVAMQVAKASGGGGFRSFETNMRVDDDGRLAMHRRLRRALDNGEFVLVFQPIVDAGSGRIKAVEALLRWADPTHKGLVSPAEFIPVLEQTGLIVAVGSWVLRDACRHALPWLSSGAHSLVLSVNVSPRQFAEARFVETVKSILEETGFPADRLQLEVTEGLLLEPTPESLRKLDALVHAGIRLAVDDFGMGYSSLVYLKGLPLHTLKIDRMFVCDIVNHQREATIVRAIVDLGHGLGLHVTAEGVETEEQSKTLQELGVDTQQGYLFARPLGPDAIRAMLAERGAAQTDDVPPSNWSSTMAGLLHA